MNAPEPIPFRAEWPEPDARYLRAELPPPDLLLSDVLPPRWAAWVQGAAEAKASPPDYVLAALVAVCGALVGNTRWPSPRAGWEEPPVLWAVAIGNPSMNKSSGLDAVLVPLKRAERAQREKVQAALTEWRAKAEVAKLVESTWKEAVKAAVKDGREPPKRPDAANPGPEPVMPRLAVSDATVEKLAVIMAGQPRGTLLARDELARWLQGMSRYSDGGSDRPFWLEANGGRAYSVERMGRDPVYIDRLAVGVLGGIQPDRLRSLLIKSDDDGLLARFLPVWRTPRRSSGPIRGTMTHFLMRPLCGFCHWTYRPMRKATSARGLFPSRKMPTTFWTLSGNRFVNGKPGLRGFCCPSSASCRGWPCACRWCWA